jgi:hypothetical protein
MDREGRRDERRRVGEGSLIDMDITETTNRRLILVVKDIGYESAKINNITSYSHSHPYQPPALL